MNQSNNTNRKGIRVVYFSPHLNFGVSNMCLKNLFGLWNV